MKPLRYRKFERRFIGERLRYAIAQKNYTQCSFASEIGVSQPQISLIINGKTDPSVDTLYCIAKGLNVSIDWLLGLTDYPYRSM